MHMEADEGEQGTHAHPRAAPRVASKGAAREGSSASQMASVLRVTHRLEQELAAMDRRMAEFKAHFEETQENAVAMLGDLARMLQAHAGSLASHEDCLQSHSRVLRSHGAEFNAIRPHMSQIEDAQRTIWETAQLVRKDGEGALAYDDFMQVLRELHPACPKPPSFLVRAGDGTPGITADPTEPDSAVPADTAPDDEVHLDLIGALATLGEPYVGEANARDESGCTALHRAASRGLPGACQALLASPEFAEVNARDCYERTALHYAAASGQSAVCNALLGSARFTEPDATALNGRTALHAAAEYGHPQVCRALLAHPRFTKVEAEDAFGHTALHRAARGGHASACKVLLDKVAGVNESDAERWTVLHFAAAGGHAEVCQVVLRSSRFLEVDAASSSGSTALHYAASYGHAEVCRILLASERFSSVAACDAGGRSALDCATDAGHKLVQLLLAADSRFPVAGAGPPEPDPAQHSPSDAAVPEPLGPHEEEEAQPGGAAAVEQQEQEEEDEEEVDEVAVQDEVAPYVEAAAYLKAYDRAVPIRMVWEEAYAEAVAHWVATGRAGTAKDFDEIAVEAEAALQDALRRAGPPPWPPEALARGLARAVARFEASHRLRPIVRRALAAAVRRRLDSGELVARPAPPARGYMRACEEEAVHGVVRILGPSGLLPPPAGHSGGAQDLPVLLAFPAQHNALLETARFGS